MSDSGIRNISRRLLVKEYAGGAVALALLPSLAACSSQQKMDDGATQRTGGQTTPPASGAPQNGGTKKPKRTTTAAKKEEPENDADAKPQKPSSSESEEDSDTLGSESSAGNSQSDSDSQSGSEAQSAAPTTVAGLRGAKPDGGFFNSGAPELTLAQIQAGQAVNGVCEGGLHTLVIEPQHLAALARGETVSVKSSTHTHFGNPTVHDHSVTYRPIIG